MPNRTPGPGERPIRILLTATALISAALIAMIAIIAGDLREDALQNAEINLRRHSLTLAAQAERSLQSIDQILSNVSGYATSQGVFDSGRFPAAKNGEQTFKFLQAKLAGLPQLDAITIIDAQGRLVNFSRYWPIPDLDVSDRDYFIALRDDPNLLTFVSRPVENRGTGTSNIYIARRVNGPNGEFSGLVLAALSLQYFEDFYRSTSVGEGSFDALLRDDGTLLARYPQTGEIGKIFEGGGRQVGQSDSDALREPSAIDRSTRIASAHQLSGLPMLVQSTRTEDSILQAWRQTVILLVGFTSAMIVALVLAATVMIRKWKQQGLLDKIRAEQAEAGSAPEETKRLHAAEHAAEVGGRAESNASAVMSDAFPGRIGKDALFESVLDPTAFESLAEEIDRDSAVEAFNIFVADSRRRLASFSRIAVDANRKQIKIEARSLKSTAATFGFQQLSDLAKRLEQEALVIAEQDFQSIVPRLDDAFQKGKARFDQTFRPAA